MDSLVAVCLPRSDRCPSKMNSAAAKRRRNHCEEHYPVANKARNDKRADAKRAGAVPVVVEHDDQRLSGSDSEVKDVSYMYEDYHTEHHTSPHTTFTSSQVLAELSQQARDELEVDAAAAREDSEVEDLTTVAASRASSPPVYLWKGPWDPCMGTNRSVREQQEYDAGRDMLFAGLIPDVDSLMEAEEPPVFTKIPSSSICSSPLMSLSPSAEDHKFFNDMMDRADRETETESAAAASSSTSQPVSEQSAGQL